jgi:hypothetical protein
MNYSPKSSCFQLWRRMRSWHFSLAIVHFAVFNKVHRMRDASLEDLLDKSTSYGALDHERGYSVETLCAIRVVRFTRADIAVAASSDVILQLLSLAYYMEAQQVRRTITKERRSSQQSTYIGCQLFREWFPPPGALTLWLRDSILLSANFRSSV